MISLVLLTSGVLADECAALWTQCGGGGPDEPWNAAFPYNGPTDCCEGVCVDYGLWWSMCELGSESSEDPVESSSSEDPVVESSEDPVVESSEDPIVESSSSEDPVVESSSSEDPVIDSVDDSEFVTPALWNAAQSGEGTYYTGYNGEVASCNFAGVFDDDSLEAFHVDAFVAVGLDNLYDEGLACGMCIKYKSTPTSDGDIGEGVAMVVDSCEGCATGDLDFALGHLGMPDIATGRYQMEWEAVDCPTGNSKFQYKFSGSHDWFLKLQVRNTKVPIAKLELQQEGVWYEMFRGFVNGNAHESTDGHWIETNEMNTAQESFGAYTMPLRLRMTSIFGEVVEDEINGDWAAVSAGTTFTGTASFSEGSTISATRRRLDGLLQQLHN